MAGKPVTVTEDELNELLDLHDEMVKGFEEYCESLEDDCHFWDASNALFSAIEKIMERA